MNDFKEFQAKNLDQAIQDACAFFGTEREKLEIEIVEDAKTGIFGLVGARKAKIRAKRVELPEFNVSYEEKKKTTPKNHKPKNRFQDKNDKIESLEKKAKFEKNTFDDEDEGESQRRFLSKIPVHHDDEELDERVLEAMDRQAMQRANFLGNMTEAEILSSGHYQEENRHSRYHKNPRHRYDNKNLRSNRFEHRDNNEEKKPRRFEKNTERNMERSERPRYERPERKPRFIAPKRERFETKPENTIDYEGTLLPRVNLLELDQEKLHQVVKETITNLIKPIVGDETKLEITVEENRVMVRIESEDSGLLIGREGQHLAAIQYLAARIITTKMEAQVRIQLDTGDYHSRQDARIESLAQMLADRVRKTGRSQSTRPMSAYQRRVIHLALQEEDDVFTRSVGDGVLKRVIIMRKRHDYTEVPEEMTTDTEQLEDDIFMADEFDNSENIEAQEINEENEKK